MSVPLILTRMTKWRLRTLNVAQSTALVAHIACMSCVGANGAIKLSCMTHSTFCPHRAPRRRLVVDHCRPAPHQCFSSESRPERRVKAQQSAARGQQPAVCSHASIAEQAGWGMARRSVCGSRPCHSLAGLATRCSDCIPSTQISNLVRIWK